MNFSQGYVKWARWLLFMAFMSITHHAGAYEMVTFLPQWVPHAQFAGYYMAYQKGIYERHGINVTILEGGPDKPPDQFLIDRRADAVSLWLSQGIQMRERGIAVVNVAQIVQHSSLMLVSKKSGGVDKIQALQDKRVSLWGGVFSIPVIALFKRYGLSVQTFPQMFSVNLFLRGVVDVTSAMYYNEYHTLIMSGLDADELVVFPFRELGFDFPEDGIYVLEEEFKRRPDVWMAFADASMEGWIYAFDHPEETIDVIMENLRRTHIPASRIHQRWMLNHMREVILPFHSDGKMGLLKRQDYEAVAGTMKELGLIGSVPSYNEFYRGKKENGESR